MAQTQKVELKDVNKTLGRMDLILNGLRCYVRFGNNT